MRVTSTCQLAMRARRAFGCLAKNARHSYGAPLSLDRQNQAAQDDNSQLSHWTVAGSNRRMERTTDTPAARRQSPMPAFLPGTAFPGPAIGVGPGVFLSVRVEQSECAVLRWVPANSSFHSYFIPPERKSIWGGARRQIHEQGPPV